MTGNLITLEQNLNWMSYSKFETEVQIEKHCNRDGSERRFNTDKTIVGDNVA